MCVGVVVCLCVCRCVLMSTSHRCTGRREVRGGPAGSHSGPKHGGGVSVDAVNPHHQGEADGHEGPGHALHACTQWAALSRRLVQLFTRFLIVPGHELEDLVQQDDGQGDLQHHHPLGGVQGRDLEDDLREGQSKEV